jgi:MraZ protein
MFKGTHHYRIDAKGRLPVPAPFRRGLEERGETAVVATLLDQCLAVYPAPEWLRLERQLEQLPTFNRAAKALSRLLVSRAADCELDSQGRILLPAALRTAARLEREAIVMASSTVSRSGTPSAGRASWRSPSGSSTTPRSISRGRRPRPPRAPKEPRFHSGNPDASVVSSLTPSRRPPRLPVEKCGKKWCLGPSRAGTGAPVCLGFASRHRP